MELGTGGLPELDVASVGDELDDVVVENVLTDQLRPIEGELEAGNFLDEFEGDFGRLGHGVHVGFDAELEAERFGEVEHLAEGDDDPVEGFDIFGGMG